MTAPVLSLASVLLVLAALHGLGLGIALARSQRQPRAARLSLCALTVVIAALLVNMALAFSEIQWAAGRAVLGTLWLMVGPLFYGYVRELFPDRSGWTTEDLIHLLPFGLQIALIVAFWAAPAADPATIEAGGPALAVSFVMLYALQTAAYAWIAHRTVAAYATRYRREAAGVEADALRGLRWLTGLFGAYAAALAVNVGVLLVRGSFVAWLDYLVPLALAVLVSAVGYGLLRQPGVILPALALPDEPDPDPAPTPELQRHADALRRLMETERPYLDPDIRLADLARPLAISERTLSHVLSEAVGGSFYDLVNGYRVREAQARLSDPALAHQTVLAIGLDAGFSSKASFNRVFKKRAGETPSAYRQRAATAVPTVSAPTVPTASGDGAAQEAHIADIAAQDAQ
ncbi:MAG: helix-turn-helix transcriptional regulator [Bacteroidota bacterium]